MALTVAWLSSTFQTVAQEYEYEPGQGVHQEEWYDPSDWFDNDPGIDYETDWWETPPGNDWSRYDSDYDRDYDYDYDYDYNATDNRGDGWNYDWDPADERRRSDYGSNSQQDARDSSGEYGWHYDWDPVNGRWRSDYGYYMQPYVGNAAGDYGWHYDWDPDQNKWVRDYGFHSSNYDFDYSKYEYDNETAKQDRTNQQAKNRQDQQRASQSAQRHQRGEHSVVGRIDRISELDLENQKESADIRRLRLENGETVDVHFGNQGSLKQLELQAGDQIVIQGRQRQMDGRELIFATEIIIDGVQHQIKQDQQLSQHRPRNQQNP